MDNIINQLFEMQQKCEAKNEQFLNRNFERLQFELENMGYKIINPLGRDFTETDLELEATIVNNDAPQPKVIKVMKPIIYATQASNIQLIQKAVVLVG